MEDRRFDDWTRRLIGPGSRRAALGVLAAAVAAPGLVWTGDGGASTDARAKKRKKKCPKSRKCGKRCCPKGQACQNDACAAVAGCASPCRPDQTCRDGVCQCPAGKRECSGPGVVLGVCVECCRDGECFGNGNGNGNECLNASFAESAVCGCRQWLGDPRTRRPCGTDGACSLCCDDAECRAANGQGWTCFDGGPILGRSCQCDRPNGYTPCGAVCTQAERDPQNCGACNNRCGSGQICRLGRCCTTIGNACASDSCCDGMCDFGTGRCP
jgi:hypothetical protein